jgi:hypothetical protein
MSSPNSFNFDVVENNQNGAGAAQPPQGRVTLTVDELIQSTVRALMFQQEEARRQQVTSPLVSTSVAPSSPRFQNSEIAALLPPFEGFEDDVEGWLERVDAVRSTYEVPDNIIKLIAVGKLRGDANGWYQSKVQYITMAWNDFKTEMKQMFKKRLNKVEVMREFEARKWTRGEDFTKYYADKVRLRNKARLGEEDILQYLIDGIENRMLQNFVRINNPFELTDVLTIMKDVKNEDRKLSSTKSAHTSVSSSEKSQTTKKSTRCYNCNTEGHVASKCTQAKRPPGSCFCCGSPDHQLKNCPKRDKPQISVVEAKVPSDCTVQVRISPINKSGFKYRLTLKSLVDTGSKISFIKSQYVPPCNYNTPITQEDSFTGINQSELRILGIFTTDVTIDAQKEIRVKFYVVPEDTMGYSCVLGADVIVPCSFEFRDSVYLSDCQSSSCRDDSSNFSVSFFNEILHVDFESKTVGVGQLNISDRVGYKDEECLKTLFEKNYKSRYTDHFDDTCQMVIQLKNDQPIYFRPRRLSLSEKETLRKILDGLLEKGIIRPSNSPYASKIVLVKKKNGETRLCVDYREINKITIRDNFPTPLIDDNLDLLKDKKHFSTLDLKSGFHHVRVAESSVKYTSFITPFGQFEYVRMPFGLTNAPRVFQRYLYGIFSDLIRTHKVILYMDDVLVATGTLEEHLDILKDVFILAADHGLEFRLDKCYFLQDQIRYLGYLVSSAGIRPNPENVDCVKKFPVPTCSKDVQRFLGLASYFRRFIPSFSIKARVLYDLIRKNAAFKFGDDELVAFETLKDSLVDAPLLAIYSPLLETELHCDASSKGFGAILLQKQDDGKFRPVRYLSKRTTESESKLHSYELELLAIVYAVEKFHVYLHGLRFKVVTDSDAVKMALNKKDINPRISRWALVLENYDYTVEHRAGKRMQHVDALSRCTPVMVIEENTFEQNLAIAQNLDPVIKALKSELEVRESKKFELRNGLVYRKANDKLLFYVPSLMEQNILTLCHDNLGHFGFDKSYEYLSRAYWFPDARQKVRVHIKNCLKCITYASVTGKTEGFLHNIPKGDKPFMTIHVDHYGPLEKTPTGKKFILEVIDSFTKFVTLFAVKSTKTCEVISSLKTYFRFYSVPFRLISDRGSCFTSSEFQKFIEQYGFAHVKVATGTPEANGQIERVNRDLTPILSKLSDLRNRWDKALADVEFAINNSYCRSVGNSPSKLLFGVNQKDKNDLVRYYLDIDDKNRNLDDVRANAQVINTKTQSYNKKYYDRKHKTPYDYKMGDFVMIRNVDVTPGINKKLLPKFRGPYEVKKCLGNDRYLIGDIEGFQITQIPFEGICSPPNMKLWLSPIDN